MQLTKFLTTILLLLPLTFSLPIQPPHQLSTKPLALAPHHPKANETTTGTSLSPPNIHHADEAPQEAELEKDLPIVDDILMVDNPLVEDSGRETKMGRRQQRVCPQHYHKSCTKHAMPGRMGSKRDVEDVVEGGDGEVDGGRGSGVME